MWLTFIHPVNLAKAFFAAIIVGMLAGGALTEAGACGKPIIINDAPVMIHYDAAFIEAAAREAEVIKNRAPHIMQLVADYRAQRKADSVK